MNESLTKDAAGADSGASGLEVAGWGPEPHAGVQVSLLLTSAALLILEISLTRFFSYTIWYHLAYLTISMALLGFGSSGAILAAFPNLLARHGQRLLVGALLAASVFIVAGISFLAQFPIETQNLFLKPWQFSFSLFCYYGIVSTPFVLAGFAVGAPFSAWPSRMGRLYFCDLAGAAIGCACVTPLISLVGVPGLILSSSALLLMSAAALLWSGGSRRRGAWLAATACVVLACSGTLGERLPITIASSKNLGPVDTSADTTHQDSEHFHRWTPISRVDAWGWNQPSTGSFWTGIGLSQSWTGVLPEVARLTYDGSNGSDIFSGRGDLARNFEMLDHHILTAPYVLLHAPDVLVIGVGGGIDIFNALEHHAHHVTGAELQPVTVDLLENRLRDFTGGIYHRDDVTLVASEGRHFVHKSDQRFDLVQITAVDTFAAQAAGAYVLAESYLYTVEAMQDYLAHLSPDGMVSTVIGDFVTPGQAPPLVTRLAMLGRRALERNGVADPAGHIVVAVASVAGHGSQNEIVLVRKSPFQASDIAALQKFLDANGFTMLYDPGSRSGPLAALLAGNETERAAALESSIFNVEASTDENPFFYNVGKWANLSPDHTIFYIMPGSFVGQVVLILMVVQSTLIGVVLVLGPLLLGAREGLPASGAWAYLAYFLALGIGFMFVEISFVQKFVLFLGSPMYALSVTIFSLLLFSACGSLASTSWASRPRAALRRIAPLAAILIVAYALGLARVFDSALQLDIGWRIAISIAVQAPIGLVLGTFMPLGIATIAREHARLVPWAWGVNGVGSVAGTTLAVLIAMSAGFRTVSFLAAALYLVAATTLLRATATASR
ncbi:MAG TPA: hypothetical protein VGK20_15670 [Candidatus Binatia bacterium]|jgi:hypothetical protein